MTFNRVFGDEARAVVILYRAGWGGSPWTRIEQTAVRNRAHDHGYDFAIFVSLDGSAMPAWVPKNRIWVGLERFGEQGAAAVIEARVTELGGLAVAPTLEGMAAARDNERQYQDARRSKLDSYPGVQAFKDKKIEVADALFAAAARINAAQGGFSIAVHRYPDQGLNFIEGLRRTMTLLGGPQYANQTQGAELRAMIWEIPPAKPGYWMIEQQSEGPEKRFGLGWSRTGEYVWEQKDRAFTPDQLAEHLLHWYLTTADLT